LRTGATGFDGIPAPLTRALKHALEQRQRLADRGGPDAVGLELQAEAVDDVRRQLAQRDRAEARQHVRVPLDRVDLQRRLREVRLRVQPPPLLAEVGERLLAGIELGELAGALAPHELGIESLGVTLSPEHLRAVAPALAPAHAPDDGTVLAFHALDAHDAALPSSARSLRKLPRVAGTRRVRMAGALSTRTSDLAIHSSKSSRGTRSREHSLTARSSPRWIAR
jgi:hypothetical protein